jgi:hypothetical protein
VSAAVSRAILMTVILLVGSGAVAASPTLPTAPQLEITKYPECKAEYRLIALRIDKYNSVQGCISQVEQFNRYYLFPFPEKIQIFSLKITKLEAVFSRSAATFDEKYQFHDIVLDEINKCRSMRDGKFGEYYQNYYLYLQKYRDDMKLLIEIRRDLSIPH